MTKKPTKGKVTKRTVRKKLTKTARAGRSTKAAKKPRKPASKAAAPKRDLVTTIESKAIDLLRSWSPARYSHR